MIALRYLGFDVTVKTAVTSRSDGREEIRKTLIYEKQTSRENFQADLLELRKNVPEVISYEEIGRLLVKNHQSHLALEDGTPPEKVMLRIEIQLDPTDNAFDLVNQISHGRQRRHLTSANEEKFIKGATAVVIASSQDFDNKNSDNLTID